MPEVETATATATAPPDWTTIDEEIRCPLCEYNLRGLTVPRCPECGFRFDWLELLDPTRRLHPYVFEHHPQRNAWSFVQTMRGALRPKRFWRALHPAQPSRPKRLVLYGVLSAALVLMLSATTLIPVTLQIVKENRQTRQSFRTSLASPNMAVFVGQITQQFGSVKAWLDDTWPVTPSWALARTVLSPQYLPKELVIFLAIYLCWSPFSFASLMVFRWSMRRAKVGSRHVLRCVVYSFDAAGWLAPVAALVLIHFSSGWFWGAGGPGAAILLTVFFLVGIMFMAYRLYLSYRSYLRFDRPFATILASQIITGLAVGCVMVRWALAF